MNIVLGTAQLMESYGLAKKKLTKDDLTKILQIAKKKNYNFIDTALAYKHVDQKLSCLDLKSFKIFTKVKNLQKKTTIQDLERSKKTLNIKKFHTIFLHNEKELISKKDKNNFKRLNALKRSNLTKYIGISSYSKKNTINIINKFKIDALQLPLNLFDRRFLDKDFLAIVKKKKIKLYFRSIFLQGTLINKKLHKKEKKLSRSKYFKDYYKWLKITKNKPVEVIMNFLKQNRIKSAIIGVSNKIEYQEIIKNTNSFKKIEIPNFNIRQTDNNYIYRTDYWKI